MIQVRDYQEEAVKAIRERFMEKKDDRQYICMPTGSGKTITFLSYAKQYHKKILVIVPSCQLLNQVYETALKFYEKEEISRRGNKYLETVTDFHISTIQSCRGDYLMLLALYGFDLVIIDEAHHSQAESYLRLIKEIAPYYQEKSFEHITYLLGVTATPDRADGQLLSRILGEPSFCLDVMEMIQNKQLSEIEGFCIKTKIDISDVDSHNGDFSLNQLFKRLCTESRNEMIIDLYSREMQGRKTIIFCINIDHSKIINRLLNESGFSSCHIDGTMSKDQRISILQSFRNGEFSILCNCQLLTEGFDEPSIDGIILARPTRSRSLFIQMIGRGLRLFPGKENCKIIDIVDNHKNLAGFVNLVGDVNFPDIESFKSSREICEYVRDQTIKIMEFRTERVDFFSERLIDERPPSEETYSYLNENNIIYFQPLTFDEANFLMWMNELKKEYYNGNN